MCNEYPTNLIFWENGTSSDYLYGSSIDFSSLNNVVFENSLMPSSVIIHSWNSLVDYQGNRVSTNLPLLEKSGIYQIEIDLNSFPEQSVYTQISFYDIAKTRIKTINIKESRCTFIYPKNSFSYRIDLINAGLHHFVFHEIRLREIAEVSKETQAKKIKLESFPNKIFDISKVTNFVSYKRPLNIIFNEPKKNFVPTLPKNVLKKINNLVLINDFRPFGGFYLSDDNHRDYEKELKESILRLSEKFTSLNLIGFGPISSFAALFYHQYSLTNVSSYVSDDFLGSLDNFERIQNLSPSLSKYLMNFFQENKFLPTDSIKDSVKIYFRVKNNLSSDHFFISKLLSTIPRLKNLPFSELNKTEMGNLNFNHA
ncbi:accessory Sec system protein Asp3 [Oenococcus oeni]|uniref:accessory Sec system protein Asp3 n=1 Tax=Oenococcus oeni TaxID=1247 RepID=UPI0010B6A826|nr:accessory Sec system protein Asp3 [Oenococcus oeni]SYW08400.1 putative Asp3-like accessory secretory protein [Oenococcus oeni]